MTMPSLVMEHNVLTTGGEDPLLPQLLHAINHATEIEIAVSFVQPSGVELLLPSLHEAIERHKRRGTPLILRILTSDYLHISHPIALRYLLALEGDGVEVKIFESQNQSFHLKSYIFVRADSNDLLMEGTAFIGSNNISKAALTDAHEWCLRYDYQSPEDSYSAQQFANIRNQFDRLFTHPSARPLTDEWISRYLQNRQPPKLALVGSNGLLDADEQQVGPNSAQIEALEALSQTRLAGNVRGLVVLGTGMGKTWLSAFDAKQVAAERVLFVAHREEILTQALNTYTKLWPEKSSGFYYGQKKEYDKEMLFASVQTLGRQHHLDCFSPDHFDYIVIDEFHHASAKTYLNILNYFTPTFLLGLTATPERTDQANILSLCHDNLVFERNLVHGIDEKILVPFHYFGIWDDAVDYQEIPWRNGKFDPQALDAQFATLRRAQHIFHHWKQHQQSRTLAFCVSKKHADFMADAFNEAFAEQGLKALAVHSDSSVRRNEALTLLDKGEVHVLFSVDLFNEGTDLPSIDTVMMLRPTESNIIFLQQLGRGLRRHESKAHLVVLDFIGNHRTFLNKQEVLGLSLGQCAASSALRSSSGEAPRLGAGCFVNLDPQIIAFWEQLSKQYRNTAEEDYLNLEGHLGHRPQAVEFYRAGYDLAKVSKQHKSWFGLVAQHCESDTTRNVIAHHHDFLFNAVQKASMTKCFKAVLLEAFLELNGFQTPPTIEQLAARSWQVLSCYPRLRERDLKPKEQALLATDKQWVKYWHANPVNAFIGKNSKQADAWFRLEGEHFCANFEVLPSEAAILHDLVKELVDYLLARYTDRDSTPAMVSNQVTKQVSNVTALEPLKTAAPEKAQVSLPYYPDLKIACGHFKTGHHDECELMAVELMNVDPERHFLARASGNSMNGGKSPIYDGDLLLFELVTPTSAGSITGTTMAIEIQDESGDNQYLLRVVKKDKQGQYWLKANNPDYADMPANETMKTFARLKQVVR